MEQDPSMGVRLEPSSDVIKAEVIHAVRDEMALCLSDVVLRRTDLGSGECPTKETLKTVASCMAKELGWEKNKIQAEIKNTQKLYPDKKK